MTRERSTCVAQEIIASALTCSEAEIDAVFADIAEFLSASQHKEGGIGGSPGQMPHLATTYAGVAAAVTAGQEALAVLDRQATFKFLQDRAVAPSAGGGFAICKGVHQSDWNQVQ